MTVASREAMADALRFWAPGRVFYNLALLSFVLYRFNAALVAMPAPLWPS